MSKIEVNTVDVQCGSTLTLGSSGKTVTLACGASQTGFGRTGTVDWCTTAKTSPLTAVSGKGYMINTCGGAVTVTLPSSPSAGDIVSIADYKSTWAVACKAVTVGRGGSKINGACDDATLNTKGQSVTMVYIDGTQGWKSVQDSTSDVTGILQYNVGYVVVAGGGGGGYGTDNGGGGGGAGGYRTGCLTVSQGTPYTVTVGGGGTGGVTPCSPFDNLQGDSGSNSVFSTITSAGGGGAGGAAPAPSGYIAGLNGGSGGGGAGEGDGAGGNGNTPAQSPSQGSNGGTGENAGGSDRGGGGGGHAAVGTPGLEPSKGDGGIGSPYGNLGPLAPSYGTPGPAPGKYFAGGGGAGNYPGSAPSGGAGGGGNGASGSPVVVGVAGGTNTGGGGGGGVSPTYTNAKAGGSGIVILRHATSCGSCATGGNATATCGSNTIRVFTGDGTFTA